MSSLAELEAAAFAALEKEERLDAKLGAGTGAAKERAAIRATLDEYEEALEASAALAAAEEAAAERAGGEAAAAAAAPAGVSSDRRRGGWLSLMHTHMFARWGWSRA